MASNNKLAAIHLSNKDQVLATIIESAGLCTIKPHNNYYWELVSSIISQQLSIKAAHTIEKRFLSLFKEDIPTPEHILRLNPDKIRACGLSNAKVNYVRDLAFRVANCKLSFDNFDNLSDSEIIHELTQIKGVGEWTAHMFLMFAMGRPDVLAHGDLGIKLGIQKLYNLSTLPTPDQIKSIAIKNNWSPYRSFACWYIWHAKDNK